MRAFQRKWINQPSTSQAYHKLHGTCVLYDPADESVYFLSGSLISQQIDPRALSDGWPESKQYIAPPTKKNVNHLKKQKVVIVNTCNPTTELNTCLDTGWTIVSVDTIPGLSDPAVPIAPRCFVVLEKDGE